MKGAVPVLLLAAVVLAVATPASALSFVRPANALLRSTPVTAYDCSNPRAIAHVAMDDIFKCSGVLAPLASPDDAVFLQLLPVWKRLCGPPELPKILEILIARLRDTSRLLGVKGLTGHITAEGLQLFMCKPTTVKLSFGERRCFQDMPVLDAAGRRRFRATLSAILVPVSKETPCSPYAPAFELDDGRWIEFKPQPQIKKTAPRILSAHSDLFGVPVARRPLSSINFAVRGGSFFHDSDRAGAPTGTGGVLERLAGLLLPWLRILPTVGQWTSLLWSSSVCLTAARNTRDTYKADGTVKALYAGLRAFTSIYGE